MLSDYIQTQLTRARYKILEDGSYFGEIPRIKGVWANAKTLEGCRRELTEVLEDWLVVQLRSGQKVPGFSVKFDRRKEFNRA